MNGEMLTRGVHITFLPLFFTLMFFISSDNSHCIIDNSSSTTENVSGGIIHCTNLLDDVSPD